MARDGTSDPMSPADAFARLGLSGVKHNDAGELVVSREALEEHRARQARRYVMSRVPSTPRNMMREVGGGVRKNHGIFRTVTLTMLRTIRERAPILKAIHAARHAQVRRFGRRFAGKEGTVGWQVVHRRHNEPGWENPKGFERFIREGEELMETPSPRYCTSLKQALAQLEEDYLTINRPAVEILHSELDHTRIAGWRPVDGALCWPTLDYLEKWKADNPAWYGRYDPTKLSAIDEMNLLSEVLEWDAQGTEYVFVRDEQVEAAYKPGQLLVSPFQNRTDINRSGYPPSHVEDVITLVLAFINAFEFNDNLFTHGMLAEIALGVTGDIHPLDLQAFRDELRESTQGVRRAHQPPIIPLPEGGEISVIRLKELPKDTLFDSFMSMTGNLAAASYRMDPSTINWKPWGGSGGGGLAEPSRASEIASAREEGLEGDLEHLADGVLTPVLRRIHPDLVLAWEFGARDSRQSAEILGMRAKVSISRNEVRLREGVEPMPPYYPPDQLEGLSAKKREAYDLNPWNHPADPSFGTFLTTLRQQDQMQEQMQGGQGGEEQQDQDQFGGQGGDDPYPYGQPDQDGGGLQMIPGGRGGSDEAMNKARRTRVLRMRGN